MCNLRHDTEQTKDKQTKSMAQQKAYKKEEKIVNKRMGRNKVIKIPSCEVKPCTDQ